MDPKRRMQGPGKITLIRQKASMTISGTETDGTKKNGEPQPNEEKTKTTLQVLEEIRREKRGETTLLKKVELEKERKKEGYRRPLLGEIKTATITTRKRSMSAVLKPNFQKNTDINNQKSSQEQQQLEEEEEESPTLVMQAHNEDEKNNKRVSPLWIQSTFAKTMERTEIGKEGNQPKRIGGYADEPPQAWIKTYNQTQQQQHQQQKQQQSRPRSHSKPDLPNKSLVDKYHKKKRPQSTTSMAAGLQGFEGMAPLKKNQAKAQKRMSAKTVVKIEKVQKKKKRLAPPPSILDTIQPIHGLTKEHEEIMVQSLRENTFLRKYRNQVSDLNICDDTGLSEAHIKRMCNVLGISLTSYKEWMNQTQEVVQLHDIMGNVPTIDMDKIRYLAFNGIPCLLRSYTWKLLLSYLPSAVTQQEERLEQKRKHYRYLVQQYYEGQMEKNTEERTILHQIQIDVPRTNPDLPLFQSKEIQKALERILYIWSIQHPGCGYVQGLNDLVTPFIIVFLSDYAAAARYDVMNVSEFILNTNDDEDIEQRMKLSSSDEENDRALVVSDDVLHAVEADAFWCFSLLLDHLQDHYTRSQPGIHRLVNQLEVVMERIDPQLYEHTKQVQLQFLQFAFRWMNCLLMRELSLKLVLRIFDALLAESSSSEFEQLHVFICVAFFRTWRQQLLQFDFADMVLFLQHLPTQHWTFQHVDMLLQQAFLLKSLYGK